MRLIFGLGNPDNKYEGTRHNVGFTVVTALAEALGEPDFVFKKKFEAEMSEADNFILVRPQTYMNNSGKSVASLAKFYKVSPADIIVVHDDLDIALGEYKIQQGRGPKVHNGIMSIEQHLGSKDFWRVRMGVDSRVDRYAQSGEEYVLGKFSQDENNRLKEVIKRVVSEIERMIP